MILQALRKETQQLHKSLEDHPLMTRMMAGDRQAYTAFLRAFSLLLPNADAAAQRCLSATEREEFSYRDWILRLDQDLKELKSDRLLKAFPKPRDHSDSWGYLYVIEGSALGSAELSKRFADSGWPLSYLRRSEDRLRWPRFIKALNSQDLDERTAVAGALLGFQTMIDLFDMQS